jgi:hypothetical protein
LLPPLVTPREPESLVETGLAASTVEQTILRILYFRGELYGMDLSNAIGLRFSVIEGIIEALKLSDHIQVKRSMGMGSVGAALPLRNRAANWLASTWKGTNTVARRRCPRCNMRRSSGSSGSGMAGSPKKGWRRRFAEW